jgi:hypothetical protein
MSDLEGEEVSLITENYLVPPSSLDAMEDYLTDLMPSSPGYRQNVIVLSILLAVALLTNFPAFPVILFRRTRFGNGQFACLIFCLTVCDLVCVISGLVGGLILEVGDMSWVGTSQGCAAYYFISSWLVGLSNYLVVCLVCMVLVKRAAGILARLQECKLLLLSLICITLLPAIPELAIRSTISDIQAGYSFCILTTHHHTYGLYVAFKIIIRHLLPAICVLICLLRPRTVVAKRISLIFTGQPAVCECGPSGSVLSRPHECPKMTRSRPDILRDTEVTDMINGMEKTKNSIPAMVEDPVRRRYKTILAVTFIITSVLYIIVDLSFQIQSAVTSSYLTSSSILDMEELAESMHEANLGTTLYILMFIQQIINPAIFLYAEFVVK